MKEAEPPTVIVELRAVDGPHHTALAELEHTRHAPHRPELLDLLPTGTPDLTKAPEPLLRRLFEAFRLQIHYDKRTNTATCRITIAGEAIDTQQRTAAQAIAATDGAENPPSVPICVAPPGGPCTDGNGRDPHVRDGQLVVNGCFTVG